jgi:phosphoserine aminotransferase
MSSNFLAEPYDVRDFGLIFAGAQKNLGPAGVTVVIVRHDLVQAVTGVPSILNYELTAKKGSMLNTPPVFSIYASNLVLRWLLNHGGIPAIHAQNIEKAQLLYDFLDHSTLFKNHVLPSDRSLTNVPFTTDSDELDNKVVIAAKEAGLLNLKGHRSVGGLRASLYNAMPLAGVQALVDFLTTVEKTHQGV